MQTGACRQKCWCAQRLQPPRWGGGGRNAGRCRRDSFLGSNWKDGPGANQEVALVDTAMGHLSHTSPGPRKDHCVLHSVAK